MTPPADLADGSAPAPDPASVQIREAHFPDDLDTVRGLFREYADGLGVDLCFQDFDAELATLPGRYAAPRGRVLLAMQGARLLGCVALRPLDGDACEMKRMYVRGDARGLGVGGRLARAVLALAVEQGYGRMRLDTLAEMVAAQRLYESLGFTDCPPYTYNPMPTARYLERVLPAAGGAPLR